MQFELNKEEINAAIIDKAVGQLLGDSDFLYERIDAEVGKLIRDAIAKRLNDAVENTLNTIMTQALDTEVSPVNIWGEREGKPTTLRAALHDRAAKFWSEKVNKKGEISNYGGKPRYEYVLSEIVGSEFNAAIKQNIVNIAGAVKDAVRNDFYDAVDKNLNDLFKIKSIDDGKRKS